MIELHRINGIPFYLNHKKIEAMENTPDTIIVLENGRKYVVKENIEEIVNKIVRFNQKVISFQEQYDQMNKQYPIITMDK